MSHQAKILRAKALEFVSSRKNANNLVDITRHFASGCDTPACLLALDLVFKKVLEESEMVIEVVPLKPLENTPEIQYKEWLRTIYKECFGMILERLEGTPNKTQLLSLTTALNLIVYETKHPLETKDIPTSKLRLVLLKLLSSTQTSNVLIVKLQEYFHDEIVFYTWKILPVITAKSGPNETYITNFLTLLEKLPVKKGDLENGCIREGFHYDEAAVKKCLNKVWSCAMLWNHTSATHKQLLIVLLEKVLQYLDKPVLMTDFLMDSLDVTGPVSLLALQGIFTLIQNHNLDYPNIFAKLYSMFEPEIFHTKFKGRLFHLSDVFLSSTHLPEGMVAAFAKRMARLALVAPAEDIVVICMFIGNLIIRHPGLKVLLNDPSCKMVAADPYLMEESDPLKSHALESSLWEIKTLQGHVLPAVANAARFINSPLPSVEWDFTKLLGSMPDDAFEKEVARNGKVALAFDRPNGCCISRGEKISVYWNM